MSYKRIEMLKSQDLEINFNDLTNVFLFFEGIGETHLNSIFSTMNIPTMSRASFKKREREVGSIFESVAKKSCEDVAITEKYSAAFTGAKPDENDLIPVSLSYDMAWQKRGKGFNSNTGQGAVMG